MTDSEPLPVPPLRLSREELTVVLVALNAPLIVGMDVEEITLSPDQQRLVLWAAQRALVARRLAGMNGQGQFELHEALLRLLAPCAFAERVLLVHYWPAGREVPTHLFAHQRGEALVLQTLPVRGLHEFTLLPSPEALVAAILRQPELAEIPEPAERALAFSADALSEARRLAERGAVAEAADCFGGSDRAAARAFARALASRPTITVVQEVDQEGRSREMSWLRDPEALWIIEGGAGEMSARTATRASLAARLLAALR